MGETAAERLARLETSLKMLTDRVRSLERLPDRVGRIERARGLEGAARSAAAHARSEREDHRARRERRFYAVAGLLVTAGNIALSLWVAH